ncbi:MAG: efflux RND transporter periplasmic adaptor subunit [Candidatus Kryptoniota bacterium]
MRRIILPALIIGIFTVIYGCGKSKSDDKTSVAPRASVKVAQVERGSIFEHLHVTGSFMVVHDQKVKSPIAGKILKVYVLEGDAVKKGEAIATLISKESDAVITGAKQLLQLAQTEKEKEDARKALQLAEETASKINVIAPFSGIVNARFVSEGEYISEGTDVAEVIDLRTAYFLADVPVEDMPRLKVGQPVTLSVPGLQKDIADGSITAFSPSADLNSQTIKVRISLNKTHDLIKSGTFGAADILVGEHIGTLIVPKPAVYHDDELNKYFVVKIQGDSLALLTPVEVGVSDTAHVEIKSGLKQGDLVATVGGYGLPDSTLVIVKRGN